MECVHPSPSAQTNALAELEPWPYRWLGQHRRGVDLVVLSMVFLYNQDVLLLSSRSLFVELWGLELISVGLGACWLLRRRRPWPVFAVMIILIRMQLFSGPDTNVLPVDSLVVFMVHDLAVTQRRRRSTLAAVLVIAWISIAFAPILRMGHAPLSLPILGVVTVVWAWTAGALHRARRARMLALAQNAEYRLQAARLQHEQAERAERLRIAREIHDIVSHSLGVMAVVADGAAAVSASDPEQAATAMLHVRDTGRRAMGEMRQMLTVLRDEEAPEHAQEPGAKDLEELVGQVREAGLPVHLNLPEGRSLPGSRLGLTMYSIVQEALTNVQRHAGEVSRVDVRVDRRSGCYVVEVADDGVTSEGSLDGFVGHGLVGMRERVHSHGGTLDVVVGEQRGFTLRAVLPLSDAEESS